MDFLVLLFTAFLVSSGYAQDLTKPFGKLQSEQKFKDYTIRIYRSDEPISNYDGCYEILRSGKRVYFQIGHEFVVGNAIFSGDEHTNGLIKMGRSITGDRQPNLVVSEYTGGGHCCFTFYIFQIGDKFKLLDSVDTQNGAVSDFKDVRGDGTVELVMYDWTFEYWNACFAESSAPMVILHYQNNKYRPDLELMHKPVPTNKELQSMVNKMKPLFSSKAMSDDSNNNLKVPPALWGKMLDLIYSGNMASAWELCNLSWPANHPNKELFLKDFIEKLQTSPYYKDINKASFQNSKKGQAI